MEQMTIEQLLNDKRQEYDDKYQIPRTNQKEEGWQDDWHYTDIETPPKTDIYYCIQKDFKSETGFYNYTYMAWIFNHWWAYSGYGTKWLLVRGERRKWMRPFAWVEVPDLYYREDDHLQWLRENFVTKEDWEYEKRMIKIRSER